jgi:predicted  nucleic acid-binding Zn-ribbon protein
MAGESQAQALGEIITWLEQQIRVGREEQLRQLSQLDQVRRQVHDLAEQVVTSERAVREIDPKLSPFKGLPDKIRALDESTEHVRQAISAHKAELDNALRLLRAEAEHDRQERGEALRRIDAAAAQIGLMLADINQVQQQSSQVSQTMMTILERQREVEAHLEQFALRLDRTIEVNRDLEERVKAVVLTDLDDRFEVVYERLQVVGEMVKRNEDTIAGVANERSLRQELIDELSVWREEHNRIDGRLNVLEEQSDKVIAQIDKVHGEVTLLEGRHSGLGERVSNIRKDIAEVVDHVREEFTKYNAMMEKQRRKQIQVLEQELRESKFHGFRPPEEP